MSAFNSPYHHHSYGAPAQFDSPSLIRPPLAALHIPTYSPDFTPTASRSSQHQAATTAKKRKRGNENTNLLESPSQRKSGAQPFPLRRRLLSCSWLFLGKPTGPSRNSCSTSLQRKMGVVRKYIEVKVMQLPSSFAVQLVKSKVVKDATSAVEPHNGLHAEKRMTAHRGRQIR
jgi:hypothetical protein